MLEYLTLTRDTAASTYRIMEETPEIRRKRGYHHGDLRAQLIEATRQLVEQKGPDDFSVAQACRVAGVSTAAPYRHFRDREEMLEAVIHAANQRKMARMLAELEGVTPGTLDRVVALGRSYVGFAEAEPGIFRLVFGRRHQPHTEAAVHEEAIRPYRIVQEEVAAVLGRREVDAVVRQRAFLLWNFVHGLSFLRIDGLLTGDLSMPEDLETTLREVAERVLPEAADQKSRSL